MFKFGQYQALFLIALLVPLVGCRCLKHSQDQPPEVAKPQPACSSQGALAQAELAYGQAVAREQHDDEACVDYYFRAATLTWPWVEQALAGGTAAANSRASEIYRSSLIKLISAGHRFGRLDPRRGLVVRTEGSIFTVPTRFCGFPWRPNDFHQLIPVGDYSTKDLNHRYSCHGLGVATLAVSCRQPNQSFRQKRQLFSATALLRPGTDAWGNSGQFELQLYDPLRIRSVEVGGRQVALERDITAPIAYRKNQDDRGFVQGFIQPGASSQNTGLFMIEPYQPGKTPVVFVHGLLSDPYTWANIANEIRADPELLANYQIWGFEYATGEPFLASAAMLRRQLRESREQLDPMGADPALSHMVLVGHSMGGLISNLQASYSGTQLWEAVSKCPFEKIIAPTETRTQLADSFFFEPTPSVTRVVLIGTPHRGSPWARRPVGLLGSKLVNEPSSMQDEHQQLIRDNPNMFSREFTRRVPTSIDLLRPDSPLLEAMDKLPNDQRVRFHTILGRGFCLLGAGDSDKVVPASSARKSNAVSEKAIHAKHTKLHQSPEGIGELICILKQHLSEMGAPSQSYEHGLHENGLDEHSAYNDGLELPHPLDH